MEKNTINASGSDCMACGGVLSVYLEGLFDTRFGIEGKFDVYRCSSCGLAQLHPRPSEEELTRLYEEHYNFGGDRENLYTRARSLFLGSSLYRVWLALDGDVSFHAAKGPGRLLDIGCNEGRGLEIYQKNGFEVEGLELNERAAISARKRGFKVHNQMLERFQPAVSYDVAVLSNVLEHSLEPGDLLRHVARVLKPGGRVWISCPNVESWQRRLFGKNWINWHVPFHITHFSRRTLSRMIETAGFEIVDLRGKSPALWMAHSLMASLFARQGRPPGLLRKPALVVPLMMVFRGLFFPILWAGNRLGRGDCMVVIAREKAEP